MNYPEFVAAVARRAGLQPPEADRVTRATLETLTDRITAGQARGLADHLPRELREHLHKTTTVPGAQFAEGFGVDQFMRRACARAGVDGDAAQAGVRAVLTTVADAVGSEKLDDMRSQLPKEFWEMMRPGAPVEAPQVRR